MKNNGRNSIIESIAINLLVLFGLLLLFEPTTKSDDYDMAMVLYGAVNGEYSLVSMYNTVFFTAIIKFLLTLIPSVSWYYVLQYIFIFISFCIIYSIIFLNLIQGKGLFLIISVFLQYEFYIRMSFTKTAGIVIAAGLLLLLYSIEQLRLNYVKVIIAITWIMLGTSIRYSMLLLVLCVFFSAFIISALNCKGRDNNLVIRFVVSVVVIFVLSKSLSIINQRIISSDEAWMNYYEVNSARVRLQDYSMAGYDEYATDYEKIGLSINDYNLFHSWGVYNDYNVFNVSALQKIGSFNTTNGADSKIEIINTISKRIINYYFDEPGFYSFLFIAFIVILAEGISINKRLLMVGTTTFMCLFAYVYMSYKGRLRHHVDVCVLAAATIILMYFFAKYKLTINKKVYSLVLVLAITYVIAFYPSISNSSYYGDLRVTDQAKKYDCNKDIMDLMSQDKSHVYQFCALTTNRIYDAVFTPFQIIPRNYYSNLQMTNRYYIPDWDEINTDYEIENYYKESVNSNKLYYVDTDENAGWIELVQSFINEHYSENAKFIQVKEIQDVNVYRFIDDKFDFKMLLENATESELNTEFEFEQNDDELTITGYVFADGMDSYAQNVYFEAINRETNESKYVCAKQFENNTLSSTDKYNGRYSGATATLEVNSNECDIWVYIETTDGCIKKQVFDAGGE